VEETKRVPGVGGKKTRGNEEFQCPCRGEKAKRDVKSKKENFIYEEFHSPFQESISLGAGL